MPIWQIVDFHVANLQYLNKSVCIQFTDIYTRILDSFTRAYMGDLNIKRGCVYFDTTPWRRDRVMNRLPNILEIQFLIIMSKP